MKVVIDTSSFLSLVRYYLPFDKNSVLYNFFKTKIESREIIVLDKVVEECKYTAKGLVLKSMDYLKDKKVQVRTEDLFPTKKFFNQLENQFCNASWKNQFTPSEFEERKNLYLDSADSKILLYCIEHKKSNYIENLIIVSEETEVSNDNKAFKKLPAICKMLDLNIVTLPKLLELYEEIKLEFK